MIEYRIGDLLNQPDITHIAHQANLYHTFESGLAKEIRLKFPRAYAVDCLTSFGDKAKLGCWSVSKGTPTIFNLYTQIGLNAHDRKTSYDAMENAFHNLKGYLQEKEEPVRLGIPYKLGCGLGNGNWEVVEVLLKEVFGKATFPLIICQLPPS